MGRPIRNRHPQRQRLRPYLLCLSIRWRGRTRRARSAKPHSSWRPCVETHGSPTQKPRSTAPAMADTVSEQCQCQLSLRGIDTDTVSGKGVAEGVPTAGRLDDLTLFHQLFHAAHRGYASIMSHGAVSCAAVVTADDVVDFFGGGDKRARQAAFLPDALGPAYDGISDGVGHAAQDEAEQGAHRPGRVSLGPVRRQAPEAAQDGVAVDGDTRRP